MTEISEKYPIGEFDCPTAVTQKEVHTWIQDIKTLPSRVRALTQSLNDEQLAYTYREGGWTVRQLVHHLADSHINGYVRFKLALTEDTPTIKSYQEAKWAQLIDSELPIHVSLTMLEALHERWTYLLEHLSEAQLKRTYAFPDQRKMRVEQSIALYAWHGNHHLAHIQKALERQNWTNDSPSC